MNLHTFGVQVVVVSRGVGQAACAYELRAPQDWVSSEKRHLLPPEAATEAWVYIEGWAWLRISSSTVSFPNHSNRLLIIV